MWLAQVSQAFCLVYWAERNLTSHLFQSRGVAGAVPVQGTPPRLGRLSWKASYCYR